MFPVIIVLLSAILFLVQCHDADIITVLGRSSQAAVMLLAVIAMHVGAISARLKEINNSQKK